MKLWVLRHLIGELEIFLTPEGAHSMASKEALKFTTKYAALNHRDSFKSLLAYEPIEMEFEFKE